MAQVNSTRERALEAALELFSQKGYEAATMGDIAGALGIKAPSLYKYFKGKEELYAALLPLLDDHYQTLWADAAREQAQVERDVQVLGLLGAERLEQETLSWFQREMLDSRGLSCRRLMALGQFQNADSLNRWLWEEPVALYEGFFERLIQREALRRGDPHVMAVEYLAPLFQLLALRDRAPGQEEACLAELRRHIRQFHRVFAIRERTAPSGVGRLFRR